jgi:Leucine-rich repeat (LRR) protein/HEAT repeat protein
MGDAQRQIDQVIESGDSQLDLRGCRLTEVPEAVHGLTSLSSLQLARNKLTALPDWLGELTNLTHLDVSFNKIAELPANIGDLQHLQFVDLQVNKLTGLPDSMARIRGMLWLSLNANKLGTVPEVLFHLTELVRLQLCTNKLTTVPEALAGLAALCRLELSYNKIAELPASIGDLTELRFLQLHDNRLTTLPDSIGNLVHLHELTLQDNLLTELPRTMDQLHALTSMDLAGNRISTPPTMLAGLPNLTRLNLAGNPLPDADEHSRTEVDYLLPADARTVRYSSTFMEFLWSLHSPTYQGRGRDTVEVPRYLDRLRELHGNELITAEGVLISALSTNNPRAANALAEMNCVRAIPALVQATFERASSSMRVAAAEALLRLNSAAGEQALTDILRTHDGDHYVRRDAVHLLARFPDPDTDFLLEVACTDPESDVRASAFDALLTAHGLADETTRYGEVLFSIAGRLLSTLPTIRHEAHTELRSVLTRWEAGATAEELDLAWHISERDEAFGQLVGCFEDDQPDWPIDGLRNRAGRERTLVENLVLLRLDQDRRAVRAAAALGVRRAVEPLRELLHTTTGPSRQEVEAVIEELTESPDES